VWDAEDVTRVLAAVFQDGPPPKYIDFPVSHYAAFKYDRVLNRIGELVGVSTYAGYSANERAMLSLAVVDEACSEPGTEVVLVWGEEGGGAKTVPWMERHVQVEIRATVGPVPISQAAQKYWAEVKARR